MAKPDKVDTEAEANEAIAAAGYTEVTNLTQHGATWHCDAMNAAGEPVRLLVDGRGHVKVKGDKPDLVPEPTS